MHVHFRLVTAIVYGVVSCVVLHGDQHLSVSLSAITAVGIWPDQAREECQDDHPDPNGVDIPCSSHVDYSGSDRQMQGD